jgi:hypothetical protein
MLRDAPEELKGRFVGYGMSASGAWPKFELALNGYDSDERGDSEDSTSGSSSDSSNTGDATCSGVRTLMCPYCDEDFDFKPSRSLLKSQRELEAVTADPNFDNPGHQKVKSFTVYMDFYERHRFESGQQHAISSGWPTHIDFSMLFSRVTYYRTRLQSVLDTFIFKNLSGIPNDEKMISNEFFFLQLALSIPLVRVI